MTIEPTPSQETLFDVQPYQLADQNDTGGEAAPVHTNWLRRRIYEMSRDSKNHPGLMFAGILATATAISLSINIGHKLSDEVEAVADEAKEYYDAMFLFATTGERVQLDNKFDQFFSSVERHLRLSEIVEIDYSGPRLEDLAFSDEEQVEEMAKVEEIPAETAESLPAQRSSVDIRDKKLSAYQLMLDALIVPNQTVIESQETAYCFTGNLVPKEGWPQEPLTANITPLGDENPVLVNMRPLSFVQVGEQVFGCGVTTLDNDEALQSKLILTPARNLVGISGRFSTCQEYFSEQFSVQEWIEMDLKLSPLSCESEF